MTTKVSSLAPIACLPGVQPSTDNTPLATQHWTFADKIRFVNGFPQKIGGWTLSLTQAGAVILGAARMLFSATIATRVRTVIGTDEKLYSLSGSRLTNITPLQTATVAVANSLATLYGTLANNPITTVSGSNTITVADTSAARFAINDTVTLSGSAAVGGIPNTDINTDHVIRSIGVNSYTLRVGTNASSSTSGGGASVVRASGLLRVTAASHGQLDGDRVKITGAGNTGGILAAEINLEFIIRNVAAGTFDVMTEGTATSSVSAAGGAGTVYQKEIADGRRNASFGQGYGMGLYGVGLYGVSKISTSGIQFPRIWFGDVFGENIILTPGNQTGLYSWAASTAVAPALVSGAPTAINYAFVSNSIVVTFGAGGIENKIKTSDQGSLTTWTASSTNQVYEDEIEGAGRLLSHAPVGGLNLIFTNTRTYTFRYIGLPNVWEIKLKDPSIGIIAPGARCVVNDTAYWMGDKNFYLWRGGNVEVIPANSQKECTCLRYVFDNINFPQKSKNFAWYNKDFNEVWFHYVRQNEIDPGGIARVCLTDMTWVPDTMDRLAAEYPNALLGNPRLTLIDPADDDNSIVYKHESGANDNTDALPFEVTTNLRTSGRDTTTQVGFIPDSIVDGSINLNLKAQQFPQSTNNTYDETFAVTETLERQAITVNGRYWDYTFSGETVDQTWRMGAWQEYVQKGPAN